jgi:polyhydroxybutyrate depolymerase
LGDQNWAFYRKAFAGSVDMPARTHAAKRAPEGEVRIDVGKNPHRPLCTNAPAEGCRPAVLILHGGRGRAGQMQEISGFDALAAERGFLAVYPEGTEFSAGLHAWNTGHLLRRQVRDADHIAFFDALIDRLVAVHGADPARIDTTADRLEG